MWTVRVAALEPDDLVSFRQVGRPRRLLANMRFDPAGLPIDCLDVLHATSSGERWWSIDSRLYASNRSK
jgi:hypothetical protein